MAAASVSIAEELSETGEFLDGVAAIVNEGVVLKTQLYDQLEMIEKNAAREGLQLPPPDILTEQVLERLIVNEIQLQRADRIVKNMNRFAHSPDHCPVSLDLNDIAEQMVVLASRFARLKNVVLESSPSDSPLIIKSDPVSLEMALFESIEILLNIVSQGGKIILSPRKIQDKCVLGVGYENIVFSEKEFMAKVSSTQRWVSLQETMAYLGGIAKVFDLSPEILLYLPESIDNQ